MMPFHGWKENLQKNFHRCICVVGMCEGMFQYFFTNPFHNLFNNEAALQNLTDTVDATKEQLHTANIDTENQHNWTIPTTQGANPMSS